MEKLSEILNQKLDDYGLEVMACVLLNNIDAETLKEFRGRLIKVLDAVDKALEN